MREEMKVYVYPEVPTLPPPRASSRKMTADKCPDVLCSARPARLGVCGK